MTYISHGALLLYFFMAELSFVGNARSAKSLTPISPCSQLWESLAFQIDLEPSFKSVEFNLASDAEIQLEKGVELNRDGDPIPILKRKGLTSAPFALTSSGVESLLSKLLLRYFVSHTVSDKLLTGKRSGELAESDEDFHRLLPFQAVNDKSIPRLLPLSAKMEDAHVARTESYYIRRLPDWHDPGPRETIDLPNLEITSHFSYRFRNHGESTKFRTSFVGRRAELVVPYGIKAARDITGISVYRKFRLGEDGKARAETFVFKDPKKTIRVRAPQRTLEKYEKWIADVLREQFGLESLSVQEQNPMLRLRHTVKIALGKMAAPQEIGKLSVDIDVKMAHPLNAEVKQGKKSFLYESEERLAEAQRYYQMKVDGSFFGSDTKLDASVLQGDIALNFEKLFFATSDMKNHVESSEARLSIEYEPGFEAQIQWLTEDIRKYLRAR
jgi:hypothetical protein